MAFCIDFPLFSAQEAFRFVEEALHYGLIVEENVGIEHESKALVDEKDLVFREVADSALEDVFARIVCCQGLVEDISEDIDARFALREKKTPPFVLNIEKHHRQLL